MAARKTIAPSKAPSTDSPASVERRDPVLFVHESGERHIATVAKVLDADVGRVNLAVIDEDGNTYNMKNVEFAAYDQRAKQAATPGTWHWE